MYAEFSNDSRLNDSRLNESLASAGKDRKKRTLDDYEFIVNENSKFKTSELGKGSYGTVKKVKDKITGKIFAMKIMNKKAIFEYSNKENLKREIMIQRSISHPNVIKLNTFFEDNENVYLILEFAENGSLFTYLRKKRKFDEKEAFVYFFQTCLGIDYLHKRNVIHRDLKPENLLLDEEGNIKLCDFGWSADTNSKRHTFCGTIDYMAPEMIKNHPHDHRLDIWCLGILLYEMLHGYAPFKGRTDQEKCSNISMNKPIDFDPTLSSEVVDLIKKILQPVPINRISMLEIFTHPWMKKLEKVHNTDVMFFVNHQDQQVKELQKGEAQKTSSNNNLLSSIDVYPKEAGIANKEPDSTKIKNNAKIITVVDNTLPLKITKGSGEDLKKLSYNESTKGSDTGSTGSAPGEKNSSGFKPKGDGKKQASEIDQSPLLNLKHNHVSVSDSKADLYRQKADQGIYESAGYAVNNDLQITKAYANLDNYRSNDVNEYLKKPQFRKQKSLQLDFSISSTHNNEAKRARNEILYGGSESPSAKRNEEIYKAYRGFQNGQESLNAKRAYIREEDEEEMEPQRVSRVSKRNVEIPEKKPVRAEEKKEAGLIEKFLMGIGCISRDPAKIKH